jgi:hypothetical protein
LEQLRNLGDNRQTGFCCYCGRGTETRDHVPSKVFMDEPYPSNLPVVFSCRSCNEGFSLDEEYLACLIECAINGTASPKAIKRKKVRSILQRKPALVSKLNQACQQITGGMPFSVEFPRVRNVALKLARGHSVYELNEPRIDEPSQLAIIPLLSMDSKSRANFEAFSKSSILPEVGSRGSQRLVVNDPGMSLWITVQPERYRYLAFVDGGIIIRIVIGEYLACEAVWD